MEKTTKYDFMIDFLFDNWIISTLALLAVIIGFIPSLRDGLIQISNWIYKKEKTLVEEFKVELQGEIITFDYLKKSSLFDIVKVNASTHQLGVTAEYLWLEKHYPDHKNRIQYLRDIKKEDGKPIFYDVLQIEIDGKEKSIYFDISDFFNEHGSTLLDLDEFAISKIRDIHKNRK
jgi:hypothetical protein